MRPKQTTTSRTQGSLWQFEFKAQGLTNSQIRIHKLETLAKPKITGGCQPDAPSSEETSKHRGLMEISLRRYNAAKETLPAEDRSAYLSLKDINGWKVGMPAGQ